MQIRRPLCLLSLVFVLLVLCCVYSRVPKEAYLPEDGEKIVLTGIVKNKEYRVMYGSRIPVLYVSSTEDENDRQVMCYMTDSGGGGPLPCIGETVRISGKVSLFREVSNPGEFDLKEYYQILNISYKLNQSEILERSGSGIPLKEKLFELKISCSQILEKIYPTKEASVLKAMLLGDKSGLEEDIKELYQLNGLIHILSISGLHVSLLGMAVSGFLKKCGIPVWFRAPVSVGVMWCYGIMTGMGVSTWRAVFMFGLHLAAEMFGRTYDMLTALSLAAILMLAENPLLVLHSGFLLSFGAVLGIGVVLPWWKEILEGMTESDGLRNSLARAEEESGQQKDPVKAESRDGRKKSPVKMWIKISGNKTFKSIKEGFYLSTAIAVVTLPVLLYFYYVYPVYSLLLNLYVIPLMSLVLGLGTISLILGFFWLKAACYTGIPVRAVLWLYEASCRQALKLPKGIKIGGRPEIWQIIAYYGILFLLIVWRSRTEEYLKWREINGRNRAGRGRDCSGTGKDRAGRAKRKTGRAVFSIPVISQWLLVLGMIWLLLERPVGGFCVTFLDVGQGDCIVMRGENGNCYMVDGGSTSKSKVGEYQILPFLESEGIGELEAVFLTHPDEDHISGVMELMEQSGYGVKIDSIILPDASQAIKEEELLELRQQTAKYKIPVYYIGRGDVLEDRNLRFTCLGPKKEFMTDEVNEISIVLYVEYGEFRMLLTGDVTGTPEKELLSELEGKEPLTVLKVAHHGSKYSTPQDLLEMTDPVYAVISAGEGNRYGHPHEELLERLERQGCHIYQTTEGGTITMQVRDGKIRLEEFKE